jgi:hypothetical protein
MFCCPDSFSAVPRASGTFFLFCAHKFVFGSTEGVGSCLHVFAPGLVFGGIEGVGSSFDVLRARTHFPRYRRRRVQFSCFVLPDSFSAVPMASGSVFMFCAPELVFDGTEGVGSCFHVLRARTHFQRYRRRRVQFSCFALPDSFLAVPKDSGPVFIFCAPGLVFDGTDDVGSRFHVLLAQTHFRRYQERRVPFSCSTRPETNSAVRRTSGLDLIFCAHGRNFGGNEGVVSRFHILRARTRFGGV